MRSVTRGEGPCAPDAAAARAARRRRVLSLETEVDQAMGIVERRPQHLPAGQILVGRGNAAAQRHCGGVDRLGEAEARQRGAIGADEKDRLDQVAARLLDRQRRYAAIVKGTLAHHPIDGERKLLVDLRGRHFRRVAIAAPPVGEQRMGVADRPLAAFDRDIHHSPPVTRTERGRTASSAP